MGDRGQRLQQEPREQPRDQDGDGRVSGTEGRWNDERCRGRQETGTEQDHQTDEAKLAGELAGEGGGIVAQGRHPGHGELTRSVGKDQTRTDDGRGEKILPGLGRTKQVTDDQQVERELRLAGQGHGHQRPAETQHAGGGERLTLGGIPAAVAQRRPGKGGRTPPRDGGQSGDAGRSLDRDSGEQDQHGAWTGQQQQAGFPTPAGRQRHPVELEGDGEESAAEP